ncbi:hypothetical protein K504DRAFT_8049 [Pleomassaria siparia CBS 279.74]|uniref:Uncharacterized protein n=1 Tax=Pleomassaria siparia CBS 279.74 TaxID=1314801 RepID=A0A6G1KPB5_9PLEO|nr:hypothetical protein K504DRAFT_8049 [Pleomassaria siparia CBS 279.74]
MAHYVDSSTQTIIAGLSKHPAPVPAVLSFPPDASTPPDEMPSRDLSLPAKATPSTKMNVGSSSISPTLLLRRQIRPKLVARISLPPNEYDTHAPLSPPSTQACMSPLPAANTLHAGHTPLCPRSRSRSRSRSPLRSPLRMQDDPRDRSEPATPEQEDEIVLTGPLTLPLQPGDGTANHIELRVLDAELERIAHHQQVGSRQQTPETSSPTLVSEISGVDRSRRGSPRQSSENEAEVVDGIRLKKPKMNMGAPLGQL